LSGPKAPKGGAAAGGAKNFKGKKSLGQHCVAIVEIGINLGIF